MDTLLHSEKEKLVGEPQESRGILAVGGLAAILASTCCLGALVLVMLGFSGAWIANLTVLEPYRPVFYRSGASGAVLRLPAHLPAGASL